MKDILTLIMLCIVCCSSCVSSDTAVAGKSRTLNKEKTVDGKKVRIGLWTESLGAGTVRSTNYRNGVIDGYVKTIFGNGDYVIARYRDGKQDGRTRYYSNWGFMYREILYQRDSIIHVRMYTPPFGGSDHRSRRFGKVSNDSSFIAIDFQDHFVNDTVSLKFDNCVVFDTLKMDSERSLGFTGVTVAISPINKRWISIVYLDKGKTCRYSARKKDISLEVSLNGKKFKYDIDLSKGKYVGLTKDVNGGMAVIQSSERFFYD